MRKLLNYTTAFLHIHKLLCLAGVIFLLAGPGIAQAAEAKAMAPTMSASEKTSLLAQASKLFHDATELLATDKDGAAKLYKKALLRYEKLVANGVINGKIYYNIGNTYFRLHDIGNAIVNYRRAQQLTPHDPNLSQNLDYALSKRLDKINIQEEEQVLKTLFFWHYDLSQATRTEIFAAFYLIFWLLAALRLTRLQIPRWPLIAAMIFALLFGGSLSADYFNTAKNGVLTAREITARKGDGNTYQPSFSDPLHAGTEFKLLEKRPGWLYIQLTDGRKCWILADSASLV